MKKPNKKTEKKQVLITCVPNTDYREVKNFKDITDYSTKEWREGDMQGCTFPKIAHPVWKQWHGMDLTGSTFTGGVAQLHTEGGTFDEVNAEKVRFEACYFEEQTSFRNARLAGATFYNTNFTHDIHMNGAVMNKSKFIKAVCVGVRFLGTKMRGVTFKSSTFLHCDFTGADLTGADLTGAFFHNCVFNGSKLGNAVLKGAYLLDCDFTGAVLRGTGLLKRELETVEVKHDDLLSDSDDDSRTILTIKLDNHFKRVKGRKYPIHILGLYSEEYTKDYKGLRTSLEYEEDEGDDWD